MRRWVALGCLTLVTAAAVPTAAARAAADASGKPVDLQWLDNGPGLSGTPMTSDNVTYHGTIPIDSPGVGGKVVHHVNGNTYFYATGLKGLSIYDVSNPEVPVLAGFAPWPHSQNEDLNVSADGTRAVISADGALLLPIMPATVGIAVFDTSDPTLPMLLGRNSNSNHTAACADPKCEWIYGSSGNIYDARNPAAGIPDVGDWNRDRNGLVVGGRHALRRDESGLVISDSSPRLVLDPRVDPAHPVVLAQGRSVSAIDNDLQHNSVRPDAAQWVPRDPSNPADAVQRVVIAPGTRSISATSQRPVMRPGEMFIGNAETNINPTCSTAGGLSTWSMVNFDRGEPLQQLEIFRPLNGTWLDGSPRVNALGCSGHWFDENRGLVAASWYEHGVHFFYVRKDIGTIREIGWFQPVVTEAGAAYWVDDTHVYNVDYARGIDIISFDRSDQPPTQAELDQTWIANLGMTGTMSEAERFLCNRAIDSD